jgi:hypothetical protein
MKALSLVAVTFLLLASRGLCQSSLEGQVHHPNGLTAIPPQGFHAQLHGNGVLFEEVGSVRSPRQIRIELTNNPPSLVSPGSRDVGDQQVRYTVHELGTGSGGTERELTIVGRLGSHHVVLIAFEQSEGAPSFELAWDAFEDVGLVAAE